LGSDFFFELANIIYLCLMIDNSLLWRITSDDSSTTHYILGTMHLANDAAYTHYGLAQKCMSHCAHYQAEMALDFDTHLQSLHLRLETGTRLSDLMSLPRWLKTTAVFKKSFELDIETIQDLIPFYIVQVLTERVVGATADHRLPLDYALWNHAMSIHMSLGGLETIDEQLAVLKKIPHKVGLASIYQIIRNPSRFKKTVRQISSHYVTGDIHSLHMNARKQLGVLRHILMYDRNQIMAARMIERMPMGATFFAVGAAHLAGNKGVLAILKKSGYSVRPVF
jgi:uncharacterized protein